MEEQQKELEFPMDFGKCRYCGEERCVAETVRQEEVAKGKVKTESRSAMTRVAVTIADLSKVNPFVKVPTLMGYIDACVKCGAARFVHIDRQDTTMEVEMVKPKPPPLDRGQGMSPFGKG